MRPALRRRETEPEPPAAATVARVRALLLAWYARGHRDLPWRRTADPWRVWVSEIMLQQTRVETVIPYYRRFFARFPDAETLARAPLPDLLAEWSGLGYYRRARSLHAAAAEVVREHGGAFPRDLARAEQLPGIGRSTAGAIVSIAYGVAAPVLDGNVKRVLTRLFALRGDHDARPLQAHLWRVAQALVEGGNPGDVNQALMELGATVCLPLAAARCGDCPARRLCRARTTGLVERLPEVRARPAPVAETWLVAVASRDGRRLVRERDAPGLLHGMWEFPTFPAPRGDARRALERTLRASFGAAFRVGAELFTHRQVISNRRVTQRVFAAESSARAGGAARWLTDEEIARLGITTATRRILARLEDPALSSTRAAPPPPRRPPPRARRSGR